ncbi:myosin tail region-interacting protein MTI1-like [Dioscorea cayenensis subsp. rotundata]|uniref:Myosin tail region-interacting protein MTI1-like n=1 Tax=Dioscorea cayennensis subsp. rotundata TaxID=55577 RepID=A0AB40BWL5_DIOCR|nr:myosin tail region-interacting protein MTI1-like [Dioscorea cayenensis subsp. rotundata]
MMIDDTHHNPSFHLYIYIYIYIYPKSETLITISNRFPPNPWIPSLPPPLHRPLPLLLSSTSSAPPSASPAASAPIVTPTTAKPPPSCAPPPPGSDPRLPEIGDRYRTFVSRMSQNHHRRRHSGDFRYDPLDYALNFDDGGDADDAYLAGDLSKYRNFSSRLPAFSSSATAAVFGCCRRVVCVFYIYIYILLSVCM